jgi:hypothetical protein
MRRKSWSSWLLTVRAGWAVALTLPNRTLRVILETAGRRW